MGKQVDETDGSALEKVHHKSASERASERINPKPLNPKQRAAWLPGRACW
jgi:hypothetical protein